MKHLKHTSETPDTFETRHRRPWPTWWGTAVASKQRLVAECKREKEREREREREEVVSSAAHEFRCGQANASGWKINSPHCLHWGARLCMLWLARLSRAYRSLLQLPGHRPSIITLSAAGWKELEMGALVRSSSWCLPGECERRMGIAELVVSFTW
jgi:hypothetical protein